MQDLKNANLWLIIDDSVGNAKQAIAIAQALEIDYETKKISYNIAAKLPNRLKFNTLLGIDKKSLAILKPPYPKMIISSGRKTAAISNYIKKISPQTFIIHIMNPNLPLEQFDLICLPKHDQRPKYQQYDNIIYTMGAPSLINAKKLEQESQKWSTKFVDLPAPFIAVIIGGKTKRSNYTSEELQWLITKSNQLAQQLNGSLLITGSRRSDPKLAEIILPYVTVPYYFYDWHHPKDHNPYLAFLEISSYFIVTGESVSVCSEALHTGKPVYIYRQNRLLYQKHRKFLDYLSQLGYTKALDNNTKILEQWTYQPLQEALRISQIIREKFNHASIDFTI